MEIAPLGDSALVVRVGNDRSDTSRLVLAAQHHLKQAEIPGVVEIAPGFASVALFYDPIQLARLIGQPERVFDWLADRVDRALVSLGRDAGSPAETREVEIPVCFEAEFALDLDELARHAGFEKEEVVDLYCRSKYRVNCLGFTPGFPFLAGLPEKLATPRREIPRREIPAGSVAIGGIQTGIYPVKSPGGWNIIGRTPLSLFDPAKDPPALLRAGDHVRFRSISRAQFDRLT